MNSSNNKLIEIMDSVEFCQMHFCSYIFQKPPVLPEVHAVSYLKYDQILNQTDDCAEVYSTDFANKHANNLLWSIWLHTVLDLNRNELNKQHMKVRRVTCFGLIS